MSEFGVSDNFFIMRRELLRVGCMLGEGEKEQFLLWKQLMEVIQFGGRNVSFVVCCLNVFVIFQNVINKFSVYKFIECL